MPDALDIDLLQSAADAIQARDAAYSVALASYGQALDAFTASLIDLVKLQATLEAIAESEQALQWALKLRKAMDEAQLERINGKATYEQIVRFILTQMIPILQRHDAELTALRAREVGQ